MSRRFWGGREFLSSLGRLFRLIIQNRVYLLLACACMLGYNLFTAAPAWYIKDIVDELEKGRIPEIQKFALVGIGIVLIYSLKGFFYFGQSYLMGLVAQRMIFTLRTRLYSHLQKLSFSFFAATPAGDLIARFTSDLINLQNALKISIAGPVRDIPQIFIFLFILGYRSWELSLLTLVLIPVAFFLISRFGKRINRFTTERLASFGKMTALLVETISGIRVVKAFGMEKYEQDRFEKANSVLLNKHMRTIAVSAYSTPVLEFIGAIAGAVIVLYGGYLIIGGKITGGDFVSFLFAFFMLQDPIKKLNGLNLTIQEGIASADRVFHLLDVEPEVVDKPGAARLEPIEKGIEIRVNSFNYAGYEKPALRDVHIEVKAGQVVALVGASGSGKTTLVNLIPRFFDLQDGEILIDGTNIQDVTLSSLRSQIAIVTQEIFLFNDTVRNNIAYGNITCPMEQIEAAAKAANAYGFIMALPDGFDSVIGESGSKLSGGQRQRLAIARALIKDAPILILDEATSALDSEAEIEVQQALDNLLANRTTIVIAHRLSTVFRANNIYVLDQGGVVESGKHEELLRKGGHYTKLYNMQFRDVQEIPQKSSALRQWWQRIRPNNEEDTPKRGKWSAGAN
ncbi:MAG: ABC transporter transmembrane domain-containing protein [SAR324 cluster bacterium]|nr:ABC transporter transmembrane domain-containing protein [SAR324 cluster bacterium]